MLKLKIDDLVILGLDKENISRLTNDQPIVINLEPFGIDARLSIVYKDTLQEVKTELENRLGIKLPDVPDLQPGEEQNVTEQAIELNK